MLQKASCQGCGQPQAKQTHGTRRTDAATADWATWRAMAAASNSWARHCAQCCRLMSLRSKSSDVGEPIPPHPLVSAPQTPLDFVIYRFASKQLCPAIKCAQPDAAKGGRERIANEFPQCAACLLLQPGAWFRPAARLWLAVAALGAHCPPDNPCQSLKINTLWTCFIWYHLPCIQDQVECKIKRRLLICKTPMTTATAPVKRGIPLSQELFRRAIDKALALKPRVLHVGAHYGVMMSDQRSWAHVSFCAWDGRLYASCNCRAHTIGHHGVPMPCYHIAAAALSKGATALLAADRAVAPALALPALARLIALATVGRAFPCSPLATTPHDCRASALLGRTRLSLSPVSQSALSLIWARGSPRAQLYSHEEFMPTITDHLQQAREHTQLADEAPRHHYTEFVGHLLCALESLTAAVDLLHQQVNALNQQRKEKSA